MGNTKKGEKKRGLLTELAATCGKRREETMPRVDSEIRKTMEQFEWSLFRAVRDYLGMERGEIARWLGLCEPTYEAIEMGLVQLCEWTAPMLEREMIRLIDIQTLRKGRGARSSGPVSSQVYV